MIANLLQDSSTTITPQSLAGFRQWPRQAKEAEGYILYNAKSKTLDFFQHPIEHLDSVPRVDQFPGPQKIVGSFHSHPSGCSAHQCYYQPPSITDLQSVNKMCKNMGLCEHVIVTEGRLLAFKFERNCSVDRFTQMMERLAELKRLNEDPERHDAKWFSIVKDYPDVFTIKKIIVNK